MILLDTHVLVWLAVEPKRLSRAATTAVRRATESGGSSVASISLWELAELFDRGRLRAPGTIENSVRSVIEETGVIVHEITSEIAALAIRFPRRLPTRSRRPLDRCHGPVPLPSAGHAG